MALAGSPLLVSARIGDSFVRALLGELRLESRLLREPLEMSKEPESGELSLDDEVTAGFVASVC
jgi:hypothetical protein